MGKIKEFALTFDDVSIVPGFSEVLPGEVDVSTALTRSIKINIPVISAAMDTVTESRTAICMAQEGGIGEAQEPSETDIEKHGKEAVQLCVTADGK